MAFIAGFIWDGLTLVHVSLFEAGIILGAYIFLIGLGILFFNRVKSKVLPGLFWEKVSSFIPYGTQFMFGTLFNAAFIFYGQSAELSSSWPFVVFLILVVLGNELLRKKHDRLAFQLVMFFIAAFLYFVFMMPMVFGKMGDGMFLLGGGVSLLVSFLLMYLLSRFARERFLEKHTLSAIAILFFYGVFNFLYFANLIPPIPLALKSAAIYHDVYRSGNNYYASYEPSSKSFWSKESRVLHLTAGGSAFVFTSVFAPTILSAPIYHVWQYYDETKKNWIVSSRVGFPIIGGRDGGYRGYSVKNNIAPGKWRVDLVTENGQHLGHLSFEIIRVNSLPTLKKEIK